MRRFSPVYAHYGHHRREALRALTLAKLWDRYLEDYAKPHYKPRTLREVKGAWRRYLKGPLGSYSVEEISRDDVARLQCQGTSSFTTLGDA